MNGLAITMVSAVIIMIIACLIIDKKGRTTDEKLTWALIVCLCIGLLVIIIISVFIKCDILISDPPIVFIS